MRSASLTVLSRCEISRLVRPALFARILVWMSYSASGSSARARLVEDHQAHGWSRRIALAIATRCHCPPDSTTPAACASSSSSETPKNTRVSGVS